MDLLAPFRFARTFASFLRKQNLQHLILHVTNHCNFRCDHCFIDFSPKRDLSLEQLQRLAEELGGLYWLDIAGGEPFLRKDLAEIVEAFDARVVQIPSNGSLGDKVVEQLQRMQVRTPAELTLSLSLDGLQATHDRIRADGNWDQVWETFARVRALGGVSIKINTVISRENKDEIIPLMREVRRRGPDFHSVILLRGDPINPELGLPPLPELRAMAGDIFDILGTYDYGADRLSARLLRNYHRYLWNISLRVLEEQTQVIPCLAGRAHMVVWGDGRVGSCEMLPPVGDLKQQSWSEIMEGAPLREQVQDITDKKCHCTHNCAMLDSILFNPRTLPNLLHQRVS